jgi:UDP-N-acetylglucosamine diphosphorylase / glucose-1-phosphate thymidylyltransferase / UDP-N-acetylgalactosamine diphosphorylase / glucosamine-1-phosphate N-acetyltransferase / galactosamine-1-phosphate N-acetyltransferase
MIHLIPDSPEIKQLLYPFTATRPSRDLRLGILSIAEKWEYLLGVQLRTAPDGSAQPEAITAATRPAAIPGNWIPDASLVAQLKAGQTLAPERVLQYPWQLFEWNDWAIREDFALLTERRKSAPIPSTVSVIAPDQIFIDESAKLSFCTINASSGPVYIGPNTEIMEGAHIRGPFALCEGSVVKMGTCVYGATTVGPYSVIGGEVKNSILMSHSNKGHEGYLGDSVIGHWCNLGAGTTVSNLRNTASEVSVWSVSKNEFVPAGLKCGLLMGDYSRSAINTRFNTGTVVGICANIIDQGLSPKHIPDFSWGQERYQWDKVLRDIDNWKKLKGESITAEEESLLHTLYHR